MAQEEAIWKQSEGVGGEMWLGEGFKEERTGVSMQRQMTERRLEEAEEMEGMD